MNSRDLFPQTPTQTHFPSSLMLHKSAHQGDYNKSSQMLRKVIQDTLLAQRRVFPLSSFQLTDN